MIRLYIYAAIIAAALSGLWYAHHVVYTQGKTAQAKKDAPIIATLKAANTAALAANVANADTLAQVQASQAQCEAGRVTDAKQQAAALAARDKAAATLTRQAAAARAKLDALLAGRCHDWAAQAACGVVP